MAVKSTLKNMVLCLSGVCLVCSAVLALVYVATIDFIEAAQDTKTKDSIAEVLPPFSGKLDAGSVVVEGVEYNYYHAEGAGYAIISTVAGFSGPIVVMVGVDESGIIHNTKVLTQTETPGLGAKCQDDETFLSQFRGWDPKVKKLAVKNDGGDMDAITASTITSRAYALALSNALKAFNALNNGGLDNE